MTYQRIKLQEVPSNDPLAYLGGFGDALAGRPPQFEDSQFGGEYRAGYDAAKNLKERGEPMPDWYTKMEAPRKL